MTSRYGSSAPFGQLSLSVVPVIIQVAVRCLLALVVLASALAVASVAAAAPADGAAAARTVQCRGTDDVCRARVSLAGGASNERVVIRLTDTDLRLVSSRPNRSYLRGAYLVSNGRFRLGGSLYTFTLNAVGSIRVGSFLTFTFRD
jgi:hypothetical protein